MIAYIALMAYILAFCCVLLFLFFGDRLLKFLFNIFVCLGLSINIIELIMRFITTGQVPTSTVYDFLILLSAAFSATYIVIYLKYRRPLIGLFLIPFPIVFAVAAVFVPVEAPYTIVNSIWRFGHLPFIILGTTFFIASFLAAIMYLIQEKQLRGKQFGLVFRRFPPLDTINKINAATLKIGFYFFTLGAVLGFVWMLEQKIELSSVLKVIFSIITWLLFGFILLRKRLGNSTPRQTAFWTIIGFLFVMITYLSVFVFLLRW